MGSFEHILQPDSYIDTAIMGTFIELFNRQFPNYNIQETQFYYNRDFLDNLQSRNHTRRDIQILFGDSLTLNQPSAINVNWSQLNQAQYVNRIGHWITVLFENGTVHVFDSLNSTSITYGSMQDYISKLYPSATVQFHPVQHQQDMSSCALYAVANSIVLAQGGNPSHMTYDVTQLRQHFYNILQSGIVTSFPLTVDVTPSSTRITRSRKPSLSEKFVGKLSKLAIDIPTASKRAHSPTTPVTPAADPVTNSNLDKPRPTGRTGRPRKRRFAKTVAVSKAPSNSSSPSSSSTTSISDINMEVESTNVPDPLPIHFAIPSTSVTLPKRRGRPPKRTSSSLSHSTIQSSPSSGTSSPTAFIQPEQPLPVDSAVSKRDRKGRFQSKKPARKQGTVADQLLSTDTDASSQQAHSVQSLPSSSISRPITNTDTSPLITSAFPSVHVATPAVHFAVPAPPSPISTTTTAQKKRGRPRKGETSKNVTSQSSSLSSSPTSSVEISSETISRTNKGGRPRKNRRTRTSVSAIETSVPLAQNLYINDRLPWAWQIIDSVKIKPHSSGQMDFTCKFCSSLYFKDEAFRGAYFKCCENGKVAFDYFQPMPVLVRDLLNDLHPKSKHFIRNIRSYNNSLAFASLGETKLVHDTAGPYIYTFKTQGMFLHQICENLIPNVGRPKYAQLYVLDTAEATKARSDNFSADLDERLLNDLDRCLKEYNPFAKSFLMLREVYERQLRQNPNKKPSAKVAMIRDRRDDPRRYNLPNNATGATEVAMVFESIDGRPPFHRDMIFYPKSKDDKMIYKRLNILSPNIDGFMYPVIFPSGEPGWQPSIKLPGGQFLTMHKYYKYLLHYRQPKNEPIERNRIFKVGRLTQQFIVDAALKIEANDLHWIQNNQTKLRADLYKGLCDYVKGGVDDLNLPPGKAVILPSTHRCSPRMYTERYFDAMSIVQRYGKPDIFLTFTANPSWTEVKDNLKKGQSYTDRPDIMNRVFELKLNDLMDHITKKHILGNVKAWIRVIEFQKRGLPHCHMLIILDEPFKFTDTTAVDRVVQAYIPSADENDLLTSLVLRHMIHGPCNEQSNLQCRKDDPKKCDRAFPKAFSEETILNVKGYPVYKRPKNNIQIVTKREGKDVIVDNSWVVPYNQNLLLRYRCHINIEICSSIKSVKYIYLYVYKGFDAARVEVNFDECRSYLECRYMTANEGHYIICEHKIFKQSHSIIRLPVHLPNEQVVYFQEGEEETAVQKAADKPTMLTGWFELNKKSLLARQFAYYQIPENYTWDTKKLTWHARKNKFNVVVRMYSVSPRDLERFYLRICLLHVKGKTSFEDVRTVNGKLYTTFKEAVEAMGLLDSDAQWEDALREASLSAVPYQLRNFFALLCVFAQPTDPLGLWEKFKDLLSEDYSRKGYNKDVAYNAALGRIDKILRTLGTNNEKIGLPVPTEQITIDDEEQIASPLDQNFSQTLQNCNVEQKAAFQAIVDSLEKRNDRTLFMVDGPGGTGKSYLFELICSYVKNRQMSFLCMAASGIAASLLPDGATVHSTFMVPLQLSETSVSNLDNRSEKARKIIDASIIIWDEVSMSSKYVLKVVHDKLTELMSNNKPFGGKIVVFGGDFRQCLPVVKHGSPVDAAEQCAKNFNLWSHVSCLHLTQNMRVAPEEIDFANWLLAVGDGKVNFALNDGPEDYVAIPSDLLTDNVVDVIFDQNLTNVEEVSLYYNVAILCMRNEDAIEINNKILSEKIPGEERVYLSATRLECRDDQDGSEFTSEFINSLVPQSLPPHELRLKVGAIVMLLRNVNTKLNLCNGTRLVVKEMKNNILILESIAGKFKGQKVILPKFKLTTEEDVPFPLTRTQFPVKLAFAMTAHKSQGQTFKKVGVYLKTPPFAHGQLYVSFSRVTSRNDLKIQVVEMACQGQAGDKIYTKNIVTRSAL